MPLTNFRDLSVTTSDLGAGFQYEFYCEHCSRTWKSSFRPYRMGQFSGLLSRFASMVSGQASVALRGAGAAADMRSRGAHEGALADAMTQAEKLFTRCTKCQEAVCGDCWSDSAGSCVKCVDRERTTTSSLAAGVASGGTTAGLSCPNCRTPGSGGRFCAECGFDMASTHKSCPQCSAMQPRQARFCTDCGHGF